MPFRRRFAAVVLVGTVLFGAAACGGNDDDDGDTAVPETSTTEAAASGDFSGEDSEELCDFAREVRDSELFSGNLTDPEQVEARVEALANALDRLNELAPDEIADEMATTTGALQPLIEVYRQYDYDETAVQQARNDDPEVAAAFSPESTPADDAVAAYFADVCDIQL